MSTPELLTIISALFGIIFSPLGAWFAYRSYKKGQQAVAGADELARRMTSRALYQNERVIKHEE
jgi:hypothetical protein